MTQAPSSTSAADPVPPVAPLVASPSGEVATAVLYGRVIGSDQTGAAPQDWQVRVTAEYEDGSDVPPRDRDSTGDLFAFKVVPGKRVRLYFEAVPYQATITEFVDVTDERRYASRLPDVVMDRIRWTMALFAAGNGEAFGRNLEAQAAVAEKTGSADIFRANLEFLRKASAKFPDCMRKLEEFERTPRGVALSRQAEERGVPVALLTSLVMTPADLAQAEPEALRALAANPRVARSLRNEAARALEQVGQTGRPGGRPYLPQGRPRDLRRRCVPLHDEGPALGVGEADLQRVLVVLRVVEGLRGIDRRELDDHEAFWRPVALERRDGSASHEEAAAVARDAGAREVAVGGIRFGVGDVNFDDDVGRHRQEGRRQETGNVTPPCARGCLSRAGGRPGRSA